MARSEQATPCGRRRTRARNTFHRLARGARMGRHEPTKFTPTRASASRGQGLRSLAPALASLRVASLTGQCAGFAVALTGALALSGELID
jgi:hypothetical protein